MGPATATCEELTISSSVLVKNVNNALPLKVPKTIGVFVNAASDDTQGAKNDVSFEFGKLCVGGVSGTGQFTYIVTLLDALKQRDPIAFMQIVLNNTLIAASDLSTLLVLTIIPEVCLVFLKAFGNEGSDRTTMELYYNGTAVVESVAAFCNNTIVVTHAMGPTTLSFADHPNVTAILPGHYPGQELGNSLVDILYGNVNPSGKLLYTIAYSKSDYNGAPTTAVDTDGEWDWQAWFDEKLEVDYRYFDVNNISVQYEFGYGLSYMTFELSNLTVSKLSNGINYCCHPTAQATALGGNPALWDTLFNATFSITNTGSVTGVEVPQLYISFPTSTPAGTPPQQL